MAMTIGMLAQASGVTIDTVRYYERQGLISPDGRTEAGYRQFGEQAVRKMKFIRTAASLGFTLREIGQLLDFNGSSDATTADILHMTQAKIISTTKDIMQLVELKATLTRIADECPGDETPAAECPILDFMFPDDTQNKDTKGRPDNVPSS